VVVLVLSDENKTYLMHIEQVLNEQIYA